MTLLLLQEKMSFLQYLEARFRLLICLHNFSQLLHRHTLPLRICLNSESAWDATLLAN